MSVTHFLWQKITGQSVYNQEVPKTGVPFLSPTYESSAGRLILTPTSWLVVPANLIVFVSRCSLPNERGLGRESSEGSDLAQAGLFHWPCQADNDWSGWVRVPLKVKHCFSKHNYWFKSNSSLLPPEIFRLFHAFSYIS